MSGKLKRSNHTISPQISLSPTGWSYRYIYIYRRLRGLTQSGNRFRFRFVFVSCVRAGGRGEAAWARMGRVLPTLVARSQTCAPGRVCPERAFCAGARVLSFFGQKCTRCKGFMQQGCSGCACARVLRECNCESLEHIVGRKGFKAF